MSGFVLVCDAQGLPLLPMAPAYARRLVRDQKACWFPHPTFPRIKLNKPISDPAPSRVKIEVVCYVAHAELTVYTPRRSQLLPLFQVIIDWRLDPQRNRYPWRSVPSVSRKVFCNSARLNHLSVTGHRCYRTRSYRLWHPSSLQRRRTFLWAKVINELCELLPIEHIAVGNFARQEREKTVPLSVRVTTQLLTARLSLLGFSPSLQSQNPFEAYSGEGSPSPREAVIACVGAPLIAMVPREWFRDEDFVETGVTNARRREALVLVAPGGFIGSQLYIPEQVTKAGITWRKLRTITPSSLRPLRAKEVVFLPVIEKLSTP